MAKTTPSKVKKTKKKDKSGKKKKRKLDEEATTPKKKKVKLAKDGSAKKKKKKKLTKKVGRVSPVVYNRQVGMNRCYSRTRGRDIYYYFFCFLADKQNRKM